MSDREEAKTFSFFAVIELRTPVRNYLQLLSLLEPGFLPPVPGQRKQSTGHETYFFRD
ncbi:MULTISPECIES: hypothetical protein [unclassified Beijerinckia]|uniref:hypothetical protein n=1 Tax=unclassified Beijerinckia TaxID=2638183 RepID=UPI00089516D0|nr:MULTISPECIES: hypothetical protein [unclassified Beijerinckia]MDH7797805.1 hypothetical protein [Beijerinckia sp. GAS462]SEC99171.1 hypothetical protein SAMN05443249_4096 [Beijerinckia sp. 28-YEA-48]